MDIINFTQLLASSDSFCNSTKEIWGLIGTVVGILQVAIPVIIILLGTIDLGKAVMAGEDKKIKEAQKMFIMRLIYGVAVFFVVTIVTAVFSMIGNAGEASSSVCLRCVAGLFKSC